MTSKRSKNNQIFGRMNSLVIPLKELLKSLTIPLERFKNLKKIYIMTPMKKFLSCHDVPFPSPPSPSMDLQDSTKGTSSQRRRRLHRGPLNLPEVDFQMPNIPMEKFSTFFGNTSEDAEQHLFRFKCTCDVFNLTEDNVTCRLFLQTLLGNALEWFHSLLPGTITSWDVLETLFAENFSHPPSPIWTQDNEYFILSYTPYEDLSSNKFENEIEEPPPNAQEDFSLATDDENPQEHWQQEELVEEIILRTMMSNISIP
jgi:hypothetical protein